MIPRGSTYRFVPEGEQRYLVFETPGKSRFPDAIGMSTANFSRVLRITTGTFTAGRVQDATGTREYRVNVRVRGGYQAYVLDYHPFDVVGWDGYLYPWTFSIPDFEPKSRAASISRRPRIRPSRAGLRHLLVLSAEARIRSGGGADSVQPLEPLQSDEMIYYVSGNFGSRKGISVGSITLHLSGIPHGPQPGLAEKSLGVAETPEMAVMCDMFRPLGSRRSRVTSTTGVTRIRWYEPPSDEPSLAGVTSHL